MAANYTESNPEDHWSCFAIDESIKRDKTSLDILPKLNILVTEIIENIETGLKNFHSIVAKLKV